MDLTPLMRPRSIAVVGASQREVRANRVIRTLQAVGYGGEIHPINPNYTEVLGLRCLPDLASTPEPVDCAVVAIPAERVPAVLTAAADAGVKSAIVLASGFGESGEAGMAMEHELEQLSRDRGLVICGPNCFGILNVAEQIAPFIGVIPAPLIPGNVALVSQSGGLTNVVVPPLMEVRGVGFSYVVSCGNQAGAAVEDFIDFFVDDDATQVIAAFVEGFKRPRSLIEVARKARARGKPIVMLKVGTSDVGRRTALAHTGSVVGEAEVTEAVLRRHGIVQVHCLNDLIETIALFSLTQMRDRFTWGARAGVLTGTGGLMAYIGDAAAEIGIAIPPLTDLTVARLGEILPGFANATNPLDGTGAMYEDPGLFPGLLAALAEDSSIDVVAVNLDFNPRRDGVPDASRRQFVPDIVELAPTLSKPVVAFTARAGNVVDADVAASLRGVGVALLDGTESALMALRNLAAHQEWSGLVDVTELPAAGIPGLADLPTGVLDSETAFRLLASAGIPVAPVELARTEGAAVDAADRLGYPVALKVESRFIQHKTDLGGVILGLETPAAVRAAFERILAGIAARAPDLEIEGVIVQRMGGSGIEMLVGVKRDPSFGPVVACGLGGVLVEVLRDVSIGVLPMTAAEALDMLERLRGWPLLKGNRGTPPADVEALAAAITRVGDLALALEDRVEAIDINPLLVFRAGEGVLAVDALVQLR